MNYQPKHAADPVASQVDHPYRAVIRTIFQMAIGLAAMAPAVYQAATGGDPAAATGFVATGLAISAALTRVMATPAVEQFLEQWIPWLAAKPAGKTDDLDS